MKVAALAGIDHHHSFFIKSGPSLHRACIPMKKGHSSVGFGLVKSFWWSVFPLLCDFRLRLPFFLEVTESLDQDGKAVLSINSYLGLATKLLIAFGASFQLPIVLYFMARIGLVDHIDLFEASAMPWSECLWYRPSLHPGCPVSMSDGWTADIPIRRRNRTRLFLFSKERDERGRRNLGLSTARSWYSPKTARRPSAIFRWRPLYGRHNTGIRFSSPDACWSASMVSRTIALSRRPRNSFNWAA